MLQLRLGILRRRSDLKVVESAKWLGELTSSRLSGPGIRIDYLYYYRVAVLRNVGMLSTNDTLTHSKGPCMSNAVKGAVYAVANR